MLGFMTTEAGLGFIGDGTGPVRSDTPRQQQISHKSFFFFFFGFKAHEQLELVSKQHHRLATSN
jgi:hypothetical protein